MRKSATFATEEEARRWSDQQEARVLAADQRRRDMRELQESGLYARLLAGIPYRVLEATLSVPFTHDEIVKEPIPASIMSGVYFLINEGRVVYVGRSKNVFHRLARHFRDGREFDSFNVLRCSEDRLDELEGIYIAALAPWMNCSLGGRGRPARL